MPQLQLSMESEGGMQNANAYTEGMWTMDPTYYTVTSFLWSVVRKSDVWFRLIYERSYLPERGLYRDKLVHAEIVQ